MANLITLADYKIAEGIQATKDDAKLELLIEAVSALVRTYCGTEITTFNATDGIDKVEEFSINWSTNLVQLTESPLISVAKVEERTSYSNDYETVATGEFFAETSTDSVYRVTTGGQAKVWPSGPASVKVTYRAGYATCPKDLRLAVIDLVTYYHKDEHKARQTIAGASIQNQGSSSQRNNVAFPDHIKRVLDLYKNF